MHVEPCADASLHAETFVVDRQRAFVGSFNFDPRSAHLNTELGPVIDSPELATQIDTHFLALLSKVAYTVKFDENGKLYWIERNGDEDIRYDTEPNTTWYARPGV